jgi:hypothetical protein
MIRWKMGPVSQIAKLAPVALILTACMEFGESSQDLTAKASGPMPGPNCAACHGYPLQDVNHSYHLHELDSSLTSDRPVTCLHCHDRSIAARMETHPDSVFRDAMGNEFRALDFPDDQELRTFPLARVDTLVLRRAVPAPPRKGPLPAMREWMTALAHMNGVVDVDFNRTSHDTSRFQGARATFNPEMQTCSAVACHPVPGAYRWPIPSRGLLDTLRGDPDHEGH